jgi:serine/threonine protein kinase
MGFSDFSKYGYQIERELGQNSAGGRITYLASEIKTQQQVVIKQFQFARSQSNWADYEAYQREIQILQQLNHPSIPRYLESFETDTGFCLVQEYKNAPSLAQPRHWTPTEVKQIAVAILEVLIYLQKQTPPIIHRDIKPENILVDRKGKLTIYLVDFGFASFGNKEVAVSSVVKGTLGFMPPEQIFNRQLTTASDLYSLGMTLICLLTETKSVEIGNLIDDSYQVNFKSSLPKLNPQFITWLEKMTAPSLKKRYSNATAALARLLISEVNSGLPVVTKTLIFVAPFIFITTFIGIASIEYAKLNNSRIVKQNNSSARSASTSQTSSKEVLKKQLLATHQCSNCDLSNLDLSDAHLAGADLSGSNLSSTMLTGANLAGANLTRAILKNASFSRANLVGASLYQADLTSAGFSSANLTNANLSESSLIGANFISADLFGADLFRANLKGAVLRSANLVNTKLQGADLTGADFYYASFSNTLFNGANLNNAEGIGYGVQADFSGATMPDGSIYRR